jgi:hypothetical protein
MPPFISIADCQRVAAGAANVLIFRITNDLFKFVRGNVMLGQMLDPARPTFALDKIYEIMYNNNTLSPVGLV